MVALGVKLMSKREVDRAEVLAKLDDGRLDAPSAAKMIGVSERHVFRLLRTFRKGGASSLSHQHRGRRSNNRISDSLREDVLSAIREDYVGFGPTEIAKELLDQKGIKLSRETLRSWMTEAGLWLPKGERNGSKQPCLPSEETIKTGDRSRGNIAVGRKLLNRHAFSKKALDVAEFLVAKGGLGRLNARDLADGVGCSIGTLYNVYGNLDGVIQALNARTLERLYRALEEASRSAAGSESQMIALATAYIDFAESQPAVWRAVFDHQPADEQAVPDWYLATINNMTELGIKSLSPLFGPSERDAAHRAATIIWSGVHGICALALGGSLRHVAKADSHLLAKELVQRHLAGLLS